MLCISCQSEDERYLCNIVNQISACTLRTSTQNYNTNTQSIYNTQPNYTNTQTDMYTCVDNAQNQLLQQIQIVQISQDQHNRITRSINSFSTCRNRTPTNTNYNTSVNPNYNNQMMNPGYNTQTNLNSDPTNQLRQCTTSFATQLNSALSC